MIEPFCCRHHVAQRRPAAQVHRLEVDVLHPLPCRQFGVLDQVVVGRGDAGVVERDVDRPVGLDGGVEQVVDGDLVGDVDRHERSAEFVGDGLARLRIDVADDDRGALGVHAPGRGQPDAAGSAGDDGDLSGQPLGEIHLVEVIATLRSRRIRSWFR